MANRRHNPRRAKSLRCYSIAETADLYGVHRNTVRHWLADGLQTLDATRPLLIHGTALNRFHDTRRQSVKQVCRLGEVFCLSCRAPRRPARDIADFVPRSQQTGTLRALCPVCGRVMTQRVNAARLEGFRSVLHVTTRPGPEPIEESL